MDEWFEVFGTEITGWLTYILKLILFMVLGDRKQLLIHMFEIFKVGLIFACH